MTSPCGNLNGSKFSMCKERFRKEENYPRIFGEDLLRKNTAIPANPDNQEPQHIDNVTCKFIPIPHQQGNDSFKQD
ncbi:hypothetical protein SLEP1_g38126 [Rubroshorea leprosula]|uniref:Uncharacterized protein n=1 Tax=Rubroshorea leprosula TaxID=152421 RepID=A0AAV5KXB6_9ROSI|nr:hypothetical protein SLEP1_g38126 [Rubroshorea leprosula]